VARSTFLPKCKSEGVSRVANGDTEKISEDVRQYAKSHGYTAEEALTKGMEEKSHEFQEKGAEVFLQA
jgi:hypothetical protein